MLCTWPRGEVVAAFSDQLQREVVPRPSMLVMSFPSNANTLADVES